SLHKSHCPEDAAAPTDDEYVYTNFKQAGQGSLELTVDLEQAPRFACQYLAYRLCGIIEELADIRERNFIYNNVMWMRDKKHDHYGWKAYRLFELRISIGKYTGRSANDESP